MNPFRIDPEGLQEFPKKNPTSAGVKITTGVMAIAGMATADQHGIGTGFEGFDDQVKVDPPRTGETNDSQVRRIFQPTRTGKVGTEIGTPVANKRNDFRFKKGWTAHRTTIVRIYPIFAHVPKHVKGMKSPWRLTKYPPLDTLSGCFRAFPYHPFFLKEFL